MQQHFNLTDFKVGDVVTFPERGAGRPRVMRGVVVQLGSRALYVEIAKGQEMVLYPENVTGRTTRDSTTILAHSVR